VTLLSKKARTVAKIVLFILVSVLLTLLGMAFSWSQVHVPDWRGKAAIALLLPFAVINSIFRSFSPDGHLSPLSYRIAFALASVGQLAYYFAIMTLMKWAISGIKRRFKTSPQGNR